MRKNEKETIMNKTTYDINIAKDRIAKAAETLEAFGLEKDSEQLMKIVFRLEILQNKYS